MVKVNWRDNPWFPEVLEGERHLDLAKFPDRYHHVWEGEYAKAFEGAYFAKVLAEARKQGRIGKVAADPLPLGYYLLTQQEMTALVPELDPINWPPTPVGGVG